MLENQNENENILVRPEEIEKPKRRGNQEMEIQKQIPSQEISKPIVEQTNQQKQSDTKYVNKGQTVCITLESAGRFGNPKQVWLKDYTTKHINDLVTVNENDLLETVVAILQECVVEPKDFEIANCTNEDLFEILMAMKLSFDSTVLKYRWYHKCQDNKPTEKDKQVSEFLIDLTQAEYKPIEVLDEELKVFYKEMFSKLSKDQLQNYIESKYGLNSEVSIEQAVKEIKIQDPFYIPSVNDEIMIFEYMKIKHMIEASRLANNEFNDKIRYAQSRKYKASSIQESESIKQGEIERIKKLKARAIIGYAQALCLIGVKNKLTGIETKIEGSQNKIEKYTNLPKNVMFGFIGALEKIKFGVSYDVEIECDLCEEDNKERRLLQRDISFIELLPLTDNSNDSTTRKSQEFTKSVLYFF